MTSSIDFPAALVAALSMLARAAAAAFVSAGVVFGAATTFVAGGCTAAPGTTVGAVGGPGTLVGAAAGVVPLNSPVYARSSNWRARASRSSGPGAALVITACAATLVAAPGAALVTGTALGLLVL